VAAHQLQEAQATREPLHVLLALGAGSDEHQLGVEVADT